MERKNAGIGDVIKAVDVASAKELQELARIRKSVDSLKGHFVVQDEKTPRTVAAREKNAKESVSETVSPEKEAANEIVAAMKKLNLGGAPRDESPAAASKPDNSGITTPVGERRQQSQKNNLTPAQMTDAANQARKVFSRAAGGGENKSKAVTRDARGRFSGSKAASDEVKAKHIEKARHFNEEKEQEERESFLKKLTKAAGELENPSETRAVDAVGYAVGGPLWAIGKELGGITKEVGGTVNNARKSMAEVFKGDDDGKRRGFFGRRKSQNSADVVQLNTQKRTVQELEDQTDAIKEGDQKIIDPLDKIEGNTGKKGGGIFSKLFNMFGKGGKGVVTLLGGLLGGRLLGKIIGGKLGGRAVGKVGAMALGGLGLKKMARSLFGGGAGSGAALAEGGGALAAKGVGRLGLKALGKGMLRAIPIVGTIAGGIYDGVTGWNSADAQRKAFGLSDGEDPTTQQKTAYTLANILDMGGLISGLSGAIGSALKSMGFDAIGDMLQSFSTDSIAQAIDGSLTSVGNYISGLGDTITSTFDNYTAKVGETVSGWFGTIKTELTNKLDSVVKFFTVENLKKVFEGAINSIIDFIKHPVDHITNGAKQAYKKVEEKVSGLWDAAGDAVADLKNGTIKAFESAGEAIQGGRKAIVRGTETLLTKAVDTAKAAPQKAGEAIKSVIDSDVVETAKSGARYLEDTVGEGAVAAANTARLAGGNITGSDRSDVQKAADTYNDGKLNVKESNPDALGAKNLKRMEPLFKSLEKQYNLPEGALYSIAATESKGHADAVSPTGARGMFQFTGIAREEVGMSDSDAWDPEKSAVGAAKLLSKYLKQANGDWNEAVTAYNAGFGTINKWKKGERELTKENKEYAIKVNTHRARYLGGETYTPGAGSNASNIPSTNVTAGTQIDEGTGLAFTPGENPFEKGGLIDKIGEKLGVNDMADKFLSAPGMRHQVVQGTLAERAYGRGTTTTMGNVDPKNIPMPASIADIQQPTARIPMDGRTISDLGGSGAKPTMQLADNTVTLDSETKRIFARMTAILDRIEGHTKDAAKNQGATIKVSTPQPGVTKTVPLSIDDPLMNEYARVD
ncbi:transglycosylase SLT domain-containing protein [Salmonella enterica]|uniref:Transglycosylase SLT domain-containing protein n=4 Tax=Salmonella enterica TaxID=28901 RepID=A0A617RSN9_SALNE|nr:transglycosylase SLT domain-containing protein [Salmonella enterica]ECT9273891.1 lytic transglycosylase domain-containing protein [Salmonella enterica subsp. enterica serovar Newport str. CFSAN000597]EDQ4344487.1 transglycosylase SLT domain-containing protein [Salmonella enterica subsp. enterica serovar Anecho]EDS6022383.1 transglycosylase SLT domain-containing protein [Salmonella enterica subsp. enterica serovar Saintpaul]EDV5744871.1 transglycosylase SLT domain-containing protein [Salmonel